MKLASNIYKIMRDGKMNQAAVARAAGLTPQRFNDILRGRAVFRAEYVPTIAKALGVSIETLFYGKPSGRGDNSEQ